MLRRILLVLTGFILVFAAILWFRVGPFNGPSRPPARDEWEALIRERIRLPAGYVLEVFARDLGRPRLMQMTATGDVIVSGYRDGTLMLLKADANGDGRSDGTVLLREGLDLPHGLLLEGGRLLVAEEHRVVAYDFDGKNLSGERVLLEGMPNDGGHSSRTLKRGPDGFLYVSIGSGCNSCIEDHPWRATLIRFKEGSAPEIFARGLRNTAGFDWQPGTGRLFGVENGRDGMGDDIPDDEVNLIELGQHYGWPFVHGADVQDPDLFAARPPGLAFQGQFHGLGGHVAPLSIHFLAANPEQALVAQHGSWNRSVKSGYRIVRLDMSTTPPREDIFLSGCEEKGSVICRPVDIIAAPDGSLLVSDDYAGAVYRIAKAL